MNRRFKGVWVPAEVWLNTDLSLQEKCLLVEIDSLQDDQKGCWASNKYFAEFFMLSRTRISQLVTSLQQKGFVKVDLIREGGQVVRREIRLAPGVVNILKGGGKYSKGGYLENCKENNTLVSNSIQIDAAVEKDRVEVIKVANEKYRPVDIEAVLIKKQSMLEMLAMQQKTDIDTIKASARWFTIYVAGVEKQYSSTSDILAHFCNWVRRQPKAQAVNEKHLAWFLDQFNKIAGSRYQVTDQIKRLFAERRAEGFSGEDMVQAVRNMYSPKNKYFAKDGYVNATPAFLLSGDNLNRQLNLKLV